MDDATKKAREHLLETIKMIEEIEAAYGGPVPIPRHLAERLREVLQLLDMRLADGRKVGDVLTEDDVSRLFHETGH